MKSIQRKTAFSLIELIATVIAITLALGILIPTLQAGKQYSKSDICLSNLKELSVATRIYAEDNNGHLPGPLHPAVYHHQTVEGYRLYGLPSGSNIEFHLQRQLSYRLRPIMGDDVDRAIICPTMAGIASERHFKEFNNQNNRSVFPAHYSLNNWGDINSGSPGAIGDNARTTEPRYYFGYQPPIGSTYSPIQPQRICNIKQPAKEWMIADAWYRPSPASPIIELQQDGPYQSNWSGEALPYFAPHFKRGSTKMYTDPWNERRRGS